MVWYKIDKTTMCFLALQKAIYWHRCLMACLYCYRLDCTSLPNWCDDDVGVGMVTSRMAFDRITPLTICRVNQVSGFHHLSSVSFHFRCSIPLSSAELRLQAAAVRCQPQGRGDDDRFLFICLHCFVSLLLLFVCASLGNLMYDWVKIACRPQLRT